MEIWGQWAGGQVLAPRYSRRWGMETAASHRGQRAKRTALLGDCWHSLKGGSPKCGDGTTPALNGYGEVWPKLALGLS